MIVKGEFLSLSPERFDKATCTNPILRMTFQDAVKEALVSSNGLVRPSDVNFAFNSKIASAIAGSDEFLTYIRSSRWALGELSSGSSPNYEYGLPSSLYGCAISVDESVPDDEIEVRIIR